MPRELEIKLVNNRENPKNIVIGIKGNMKEFAKKEVREIFPKFNKDIGKTPSCAETVNMELSAKIRKNGLLLILNLLDSK